MSTHENTNTNANGDMNADPERPATPVMDEAEDRKSSLNAAMGKLTTESPAGNEKQTPTQKKTKSTFSLSNAMTNKASSRNVTPVQSEINHTPKTPDPTPNMGRSATSDKPVGAGKVGASFSMGGRLIGGAANEPEWTQEQLAYFEKMKSSRFPTISVSDSRKSVPDESQKYVARSADGNVSATSMSVHPDIPLSEFVIGIGKAKPDDKLKPRMYSDVVMVGKNRDWVLTQWVSKGVIMEPVPASVRAGSKRGNRVIGVHFARFGFPVNVFGPVFGTLNDSMKGLMDSVPSTNGYYWMNASWGVSNNGATFGYKTQSGSIATIKSLNDAMDMLGTQSSMCVATFAISVCCEYEKKNGRAVPDTNKYMFSVKCHNVLHIKKTDYRGPPQTAAVGYSVTSDIMNSAEPLSKPAVMDSILGQTSGLFGNLDANPFTMPTTEGGINAKSFTDQTGADALM